MKSNKKNKITNYKLILQTLQNKEKKLRLGKKKHKVTQKIKKIINKKKKILKI